jgi:hypothetical protein
MPGVSASAPPVMRFIEYITTVAGTDIVLGRVGQRQTGLADQGELKCRTAVIEALDLVSPHILPRARAELGTLHSHRHPDWRSCRRFRRYAIVTAKETHQRERLEATTGASSLSGIRPISSAPSMTS